MNRRNKHLVLWTVAVIAAMGFSVGVAAQRRGLPDSVVKAIKDLMPNGRVTEVEGEQRVVRMYEVEVRENGQERDVVVAEDGVVLEIERDIAADAVPAAVAETVRQLNRTSRVSEVAQIEVLAELRAVKLDKPRTEYKAELRRGRHEVDVRIAADGTIVGRNLDDDEDDDEDD